ncbi:hypothetical protein Ancab_029731 [Ancistrocladus abbreviatus]
MNVGNHDGGLLRDGLRQRDFSFAAAVCRSEKRSQANDHQLKGSFIGVLKSSCPLSNILHRRLREVVPHYRFRHLGGRMVLLIVDGESDLATIIANDGDTLSLWFEELWPWKKADIGQS